MRALVTGATGFVGGHLVDALVDRGDQVICLVRPSSDRTRLAGLGVDFAVGDVADPPSLPAAVDGVDVVFHLAAMLKQPWHPEFMTINAEGVGHVAAACARATAPPVLVLVSSVAAAGPGPGGAPLREGDPPAPVSRYGRSKLGGEQAARTLAGAVPTTVVRPPIVFGERDRTSLPMFQLATRGWHLVPTLRGGRVSMVHVVDLAAALIAAAERGERLAGAGAAPGTGIYYAAAEEQPSIEELGGLLAAAVGRGTPRTLRAPALLTRAAGGAAELVARLRGRPSILNYDKSREATAGSWACSIDKAREQLGYAPGASLAARLARTADWYRSTGWL